MKEPIVAAWLLPREEDKPELNQLIKKLSQKYHSAIFEPHVTLYATKNTSINFEEIAKALSRKVAPFCLDVQGIGYTNLFTQTLYLTFQESQALRNLTFGFDKQIEDPDFVYKPHLSLAYAQMPLKDQEHLSQTITLKNKIITFDRIKVIQAMSPVTSKEDVDSWQHLFEFKLNSEN